MLRNSEFYLRDDDDAEEKITSRMAQQLRAALNRSEIVFSAKCSDEEWTGKTYLVPRAFRRIL